MANKVKEVYLGGQKLFQVPDVVQEVGTSTEKVVSQLVTKSLFEINQASIEELNKSKQNKIYELLSSDGTSLYTPSELLEIQQTCESLGQHAFFTLEGKLVHIGEIASTTVAEVSGYQYTDEGITHLVSFSISSSKTIKVIEDIILADDSKVVHSTDVVQELGKDTTKVMSQNAVQEALNELSSEVKNLTEITWAELKDLRDNSKLVPGMQYRITDYQCTTTQEDTQSAGHQFDIIVVADDVNILNENARAIQHEGDEYFKDSNLAAWGLKYCLDNDIDRFLWADSTNGKGVIYRMIDEWNNDCPYDFKNIQYKRYKATGAYIDILNEEDWETNGYVWPSINSSMGSMGDESDFVWRYTFNRFNDDNDYEDSSIYCFNDELYSIIGDGYPFINIAQYNVIKPYKVTVLKDDTSISEPYSLNNIVFAPNDLERDEGGQGVKTYANEFAEGCSNMTFGGKCSGNTFGLQCSGNTFGNDCVDITFGNYCDENTFGNYCYNIILGFECSGNAFGNASSGITFGHRCSNNIIGGYGDCITFGGECSGNTLGLQCINMALENNVSNIQVTGDGLGEIRNIHIHEGVTGDYYHQKVINIPTHDNKFCTEVRTSDDVIINV